MGQFIFKASLVHLEGKMGQLENQRSNLGLNWAKFRLMQAELRLKWFNLRVMPNNLMLIWANLKVKQANLMVIMCQLKRPHQLEANMRLKEANWKLK